MRTIVIALALTSCVSLALVRAYSVEPVRQSWSGWAPSEFPNNYVSQYITCNFDSLKYVELFAGEMGAAGNNYRVGVEVGGAEVMYSFGTQEDNHEWVKFDGWDTLHRFTKGETLEFVFTRTSQSDSINYYWDETDPYKYGKTDPPPCSTQAPLFCDLCMRVYGVMDADGSGHGSFCVAV